MKAESTTRPVTPFEIEINGEVATVIFYTNVTKKEEVLEEGEPEKYTYDEYRLDITNRSNLSASIEQNYDAWLQIAIEKENEAEPETDKEKILRLEKENKQLGVELSEREINEIMLGVQISDLEIQLLELKGGM